MKLIISLIAAFASTLALASPSISVSRDEWYMGAVCRRGTITILVDDKPVGKVLAGEKLEVPVSPGPHRVRITSQGWLGEVSPICSQPNPEYHIISDNEQYAYRIRFTDNTNKLYLQKEYD